MTQANPQLVVEPVAEPALSGSRPKFSLQVLVNHPWPFVALLTLVSFALIVPSSIGLPAFGDEIRTWRDSILVPYWRILTWHHNPDHAPLSYLLVKATVDIARTDRGWVMRIPAMLCGILCVPAAFYLGRRIASNAAGLLMAAFTAVDLNVVWQSQQARMYSMLMLIALLVFQRLVRLARAEETGLRSWIVTGLLLGIGIWTHFASMALWAGLLTVTIGLIRKQRSDHQRMWRTIGHALAAFGIALFMASFSLLRLHAISETPPVPFGLNSSLNQLHALMSEFAGGEIPTAIASAAALFGLWILFQRDRITAMMLVVTATVTIVGLLAAARFRAINGARYLTVAQPAFWIGITLAALAGLAYPKQWVRAVVMVALAGALGFQTYRSVRPEAYTRTHALARQFAQAVAYVQRHKAPGDRVLYTPSTTYALYGQYFRLPIDSFFRDSTPIMLNLSPPVQRQRYAEQFAHWRKNPTWMIVVGPLPPGDKRPVDNFVKMSRLLANVYLTNGREGPLPKERPLRVVLVKFSRGKVQAWDFHTSPDPTHPKGVASVRPVKSTAAKAAAKKKK